jgi:hypothetical protein
MGFVTWTKFAVAVVPVCCLMLALSQMNAPRAEAESPQSSSVLEGAPEQQGRAAAATLPLRWRVTPIAHLEGVANRYCGSQVIVKNLTNSTVTVEVEWFHSGGGAAAIDTGSIYFQKQASFATSLDIRPVMNVNQVSDIAEITHGFVNVHASDPRILVSAIYYCNSTTGNAAANVSMMNVPAYPVGATAQYFQAGMPARWTAPMAEPESPEASR